MKLKNIYRLKKPKEEKKNTIEMSSVCEVVNNKL